MPSGVSHGSAVVAGVAAATGSNATSAKLGIRVISGPLSILLFVPRSPQDAVELQVLLPSPPLYQCRQGSSQSRKTILVHDRKGRRDEQSWIAIDRAPLRVG